MTVRTFKESLMKVKYFEDTDTALVEFADRKIAETREISEAVNMTIEHARDNANLPERTDH